MKIYNYLRICPICFKYMECLRTDYRIVFTCKECQYGNIYNNIDVMYGGNNTYPEIEYRYYGDIKIQNNLNYNNTLILCKNQLMKTLEPRINIYKLTIDKLKIYELFS